jgi:hypothetical protein
MPRALVKVWHELEWDWIVTIAFSHYFN